MTPCQLSPSSGMMCSVTVSPASLMSLTMSACGMLMMDCPFTARIRSPTFSFPHRSAGLPSMMRPILCGTAGDGKTAILKRDANTAQIEPQIEVERVTWNILHHKPHLSQNIQEQYGHFKAETEDFNMRHLLTRQAEKIPGGLLPHYILNSCLILL